MRLCLCSCSLWLFGIVVFHRISIHTLSKPLCAVSGQNEKLMLPVAADIEGPTRRAVIRGRGFATVSTVPNIPIVVCWSLRCVGLNRVTCLPCVSHEKISGVLEECVDSNP